MMAESSGLTEALLRAPANVVAIVTTSMRVLKCHWRDEMRAKLGYTVHMPTLVVVGFGA